MSQSESVKRKAEESHDGSPKKPRSELKIDEANQVLLPKNSNQALALGQFAIDFMAGRLGSGPSQEALDRVALFHTDSVLCGLSALALKTNAPTILRKEALDYPLKNGVVCLGDSTTVHPEKAVVANVAAVREWDSNGTVFGYNEKLGHKAGEFGHNDFYPVVIAACTLRNLDGNAALRGMLLIDEIRGRLAEVFSLKTYKIDHVVHGAIASAAVYGAIMGATAEQIESAIGMVVAHYIPFRAIRAGHQLSDSKGASAAISAEVAVLAVRRAMNGFIGPKDIFRNPEAIFRLYQPTQDGSCPFNLVLTHSGSDFAVMGMHFKLGLYEHQSAGALQAVIDLVHKKPHLASINEIKKVKIVCYQPAFGIIGDPAKRDPHTRQSADHSMVYIVATLLHKAANEHAWLSKLNRDAPTDAIWQHLMLAPDDYGPKGIHDKERRQIMERIAFEHGGPSYDEKYPLGIPTSVVITDASGVEHDSGLIMFPAGHAKNNTANLKGILQTKFELMARLALANYHGGALPAFAHLEKISAAELKNIYSANLVYRDHEFDEN